MSIEVRLYRQALRDIPRQAGYPYSVVWPEPPAIYSPSEMAPSPEEVNRQRSIQSIEQEFEISVAKITEGYTESEILTWDQQALEAQAFLLDNTFDTPLIDAILSGGDKTKLDFCKLIISKRDVYKPAIGAALAAKNKSLTEIGEDGLRPVD